MKKFTGVILGVLILCFVSVANAANSNQASTQHVEAVSKPSEFSLLELQEKLKKIILPKYPETIFEQRPFDKKMEPYSLIIHFRYDKNKFHITNNNGNLSTEETKNFPVDFSEFILRLVLTSDYYTYTHQERLTRSEPKSFGATFRDRYKLKALPENFPEGTTIPDTPNYHWLYSAYDLLYQHQLVDFIPDRRRHAMGELTRRGLANATARFTDRENIKAQETINKEPELKNALKVLQQEFARELAEYGLHPEGLQTFSNGKTWPDRYGYLSLDFSYGKGFDKKLRKQIEDTIADYAAAWFKSNSSTAAAAQK